MPIEPVLPAYGGACIASLAPALLGREAPAWLPRAAATADQVVLLVLDGLGWEQLVRRWALAPTLAGMEGGPITSVAPTTTATALTSITTGLTPAEHGVVGYQVRVGEGKGEVMNVLRWRTPQGDARQSVPPADFMRQPVFGGTAPPVVSRLEFTSTGFTEAHLRGARLHGWSTPSALVVEVETLLAAGEPFVYAYYDGIDKIAHERGLGRHYEAEITFADRMVADLLAVLPAHAALLVTADHGQVDVGDACVPIDAGVMADVDLLSGEGRFRWLHARPGTAARVADRARAAHGHQAWVCTRDEIEEVGWFGGPLPPAFAARLGDVALVAHAPVAFLDPAEQGGHRLRSRHGSLTAAEMFVPLLA